MAKQLQHNSNGGPCRWLQRVGLMDDPKTGRFGVSMSSEDKP